MEGRLRTRLFQIALVAACNVVVAGSVHAQSVGDMAARWGLLGNWRDDCSAPASEEDTSYTYAVRNGRLFLERGPGSGDDASPIASARPDDRGELELVIDFSSGPRRNVMAKGDDGRSIRVVENQSVTDRSFTVTNGVLENGRETPWMHRCR